MKEKFLFPSMIDGGLRALLLTVVCDLSFSTLVIRNPVTISFVVCAIFSLVYGISSGILIWQFTTVKTILLFYITSFGWLIAGCLLNGLNMLTVRFRFFPLRETSNGDGILLLFLLSGYLIVTVVFRAVFLVVCLIRSAKRPSNADA